MKLFRKRVGFGFLEGLTSKIYSILAVLLLVFVLGVFFYFLSNRGKVVQKIQPTSQEQAQINFLKTNFPYKEVKPGKTIKLGCQYESEKTQEVNYQISFFANEPIFNEAESAGQSFLVYAPKENQEIKAGNGEIVVEFTVPSNLPTGEYRGFLGVNTLPDYQPKGGCRTDPFVITNDRPSLLILGLVVPDSPRDYFPILPSLDINLVFSLYSAGNFNNLVPKLSVFDPISEEMRFGKELDKISFSKGKKADYEVNLSDFSGSGPFFLDLSFYDGNGNLVSAGGRWAIYLGLAPQIEKAEIIFSDGEVFKVKMGYRSNSNAGKALSLLAIVRGSNGKECGFTSFDLAKEWPEEISIPNTQDCQGKSVLVTALSLKKSGKYLSVFKTEKN